jgi:hypothetical protein
MPVGTPRHARIPDDVRRIEEFFRKSGLILEGPLNGMLAQLRASRGNGPECASRIIELRHIGEMCFLLYGGAQPSISVRDTLALRRLWSLFETMEYGMRRISMDCLCKECKPLDVPEGIREVVLRGGGNAIQSVEAGPFSGSLATGFLRDGRLLAILVRNISLQPDALGQMVEVPSKIIFIILPD